MIQSKKDLKFYLQEDRIANLGQAKIGFLKSLALRIYGSDGMMAYSYLQSLRQYEYGLNCLKGRGILNNIRCFYYRYRHHRRGIRYNISIGPNMVGWGLRIPHIIGGGLIINCNSMGNHCIANAGVVVGNKSFKENRAVIGDHVELTIGCKVIGGVTLGNHAIVAPNSVVIKDVPANCVVSGVPAQIIKQNGQKVKQ